MRWPLLLAVCSLLLSTSAQAQAGVLKNVKLGGASGGLEGILGPNDEFGSSMTRLGDLDGDGIEDIAVGAAEDSTTLTFEGSVYVLFLNADGTVKSHTKITTGSGGLSTTLGVAGLFGTSLSSRGDLNGDGNIELAVGAMGDRDGGISVGAVYILSLASDGTVVAERKISATAGGFSGVLEDFDRFGFGLSLLGDPNGDGFVDLAVGATHDDDGSTNAGAVWILSLRPDFSVLSHVKISATSGAFGGTLEQEDHFGSSIENIGDLDGDGVCDLAVGASAADGGVVDTGCVWFLFMSLDGTVRSESVVGDADLTYLGGLARREFFGCDIAIFQDVSTPPLRLLVGAPGGGGTTVTGAFWSLDVAPDGSLLAAGEFSGRTGGIGGVGFGSELGSSVALLGDLDQDGFPEIAAGAVGDGDGGACSGAAWVYSVGARPSQVVRNGAGVNPLCFSGSGPPLLGTVWTGSVDATVNPNAGLTIVAARAAPVSGIFLGSGELLVDILSGGFVFDFFVSSSGTTDVVQVGIPNDFAVVGLEVHSQAAVFGGGSGVLCNALDLVLGG